MAEVVVAIVRWLVSPVQTSKTNWLPLVAIAVFVVVVVSTVAPVEIVSWPQMLLLLLLLLLLV